MAFLVSCVCVSLSLRSILVSVFYAVACHTRLHPHTSPSISKTQFSVIHANNVASPLIFMIHLFGTLLKSNLCIEWALHWPVAMNAYQHNCMSQGSKNQNLATIFEMILQKSNIMYLFEYSLIDSFVAM